MRSGASDTERPARIPIVSVDQLKAETANVDLNYDIDPTSDMCEHEAILAGSQLTVGGQS